MSIFTSNNNENNLLNELKKYNEPKKILSYGTAGFRDRSDLPLNYIYFRMGIFSILRSLSISSSYIGIMITASHNLEIDNGLKLVDYDGSMLSSKWEPYAMKLANCTSTDFLKEYKTIIELENINMIQSNQQNVIVIGYDTRLHSIEFLKDLEHGIKLSGGIILNLGEVITPIVHFVVRRMNELLITNHSNSINNSNNINRNNTCSNNDLKSIEPSIQWIHDYYHTLSVGFIELLSTVTTINKSNKKKEFSLILDASFGVGSITVQQFINYYHTNFSIPQQLQQQHQVDNTMNITNYDIDVVEGVEKHIVPSINIDIRNKAYEGKVNQDCGAEHVQKLQLPPCNINSVIDREKLICSFDGDGDRLVFHTYIYNTWYLYDGDKIAVLFSIFLKQELEITGLLDRYSFGIIQTAYANGASTQYLQSLNIPTYFTKTGVKYLHHKAINYDISVYFEANGHGTIIFSNRFKEELNNYLLNRTISSSNNDNNNNERIVLGYRRLLACTKLINPAIGDALSDMLLSIAILEVLNMDRNSWNTLYVDYPSKQEKVIIPNKDLIQCNIDESKVIQPIEFQYELELIMKKIKYGRCFIRPSGTEDIVRIYAEASTMNDVNELINLTKIAIDKYFK